MNGNASTVGGGAVPAITTANLTNFTRDQVRELYSASGDYAELKKRGLEVLVRGVLGPLVQWCNSRMEAAAAQSTSNSSLASSTSSSKTAVDDRRSEDVDDGKGLGLVSTEDDQSLGTGSNNATNNNNNNLNSARRGTVAFTSAPGGKGLRIEDDPTAFENLKHRKQVLIEGVKRFNFKAKKGMQYLLDSGVIPSRTPKDIAKFLLHTEGLNKSTIGEFLGEG